MEVNPNRNMAIVPVTNRTYLARPHQRTALAGQDDTKSSENPSKHESRRLRRVIPFEKGHLVDIYI